MSALDRFANWNIHFSKPSSEQVELPADITQSTSEELGELFTRLTSWTDYIASQLAVAQLEERAALKKKEFTENTMFIKRLGSQAKGERITAIKAEISIHPDVVSLDDDYEEKYAYRKLVEMLLNNHERDLALVSREITRRSTENRRSF